MENDCIVQSSGSGTYDFVLVGVDNRKQTPTDITDRNTYLPWRLLAMSFKSFGLIWFDLIWVIWAYGNCQKIYSGWFGWQSGYLYPGKFMACISHNLQPKKKAISNHTASTASTELP